MLRRLAAWLVALLATFVATPERVDALDASDAEERRHLEPIRTEARDDQGDERGTETTAVALLSSRQLDVGRIQITEGGDLGRSLSAALWKCRDRGGLKVQLLLPADASVEAIDEVARSCGLLFSRQRRLLGEDVAEYYVDLYAIPMPAAKDAEPARGRLG